MARRKSNTRVGPQGAAERRTAARPAQPPIPPEVQLKWGLALLGEPAAHEYLTWLRCKLQRDSSGSLLADSHTIAHNP